MMILAKIIGVVIVGMGTVIALNPGVLRAVMNFWRNGKRIYIAGLVRLLFGAIFLSIAPACRLPAVVTVLGVLMIIGGITIFLVGPERIRKVFAWWETKPPLMIRLMGLVALTIGVLILYSI